MPQNFSGQKLFGRSFVGQDLQHAIFTQVKTGQTWFTAFWFYVGVFVISLLSGMLIGVGAYLFVGLTEMLLTGNADVAWDDLDKRIIPILLMINLFILYNLMISVRHRRLENFLKLMIFLLLLIIAVAAVAMAGAAVAMAGAGAGAGAAVAVAGAGAGAGAIVIINFLLMLIFIAYRTHQEDPQFSYLRTFGLQLATFFSTHFNRANLTEANFYQANLKHANFADATLIRTDFRETQNLKLAYVKNTILQQKAVRELLVHGKTDETDFKQMDLHGAYLVGADLQQIDFTDANFNQADLSGANLRNANLTQIQAIGTNFENADLTGACLEAWNIDSTTCIKNIHADYVYLKNNQQERRPSSGTFSDGEFSKLFQEVLDTVDLIFKEGEFNIQVLAKTLDEIRDKLHIQVETGEDIAVKSIEDKGDGVFVVRVTVPQGTDKAEIHEAFMQEYYENKALISEKDKQIQFLQNLTQQFATAPKPDIYVQAHSQANHSGEQNMFDKSEQNRSINFHGEAKNINANTADGVTQNMTVNEHHHAANEPPMEIVNRIQTLIDQAVKLDENVKNMAQMTLTGLKSAINESKSIDLYANALVGIAQEFNNIGDIQTAGYIEAEVEKVKAAYQQ